MTWRYCQLLSLCYQAALFRVPTCCLSCPITAPAPRVASRHGGPREIQRHAEKACLLVGDVKLIAIGFSSVTQCKARIRPGEALDNRSGAKLADDRPGTSQRQGVEPSASIHSSMGKRHCLDRLSIASQGLLGSSICRVLPLRALCWRPRHDIVCTNNATSPPTRGGDTPLPRGWLGHCALLSSL